ncbi:MAG: TonB-dependent receptor [Candidatus Symbiothrix sp.]|nr:TonB-dependent receptor [Candidatus Symbiothrix sp.]
MKRLLIFLWCFASCSVSMFAQQVKDNHLTIETAGEPIKTVFKKITKASNYKFFYDESVIGNTPAVNLKLNDVSLETLLAALTEQTGLEFTINENTIMVSRKKQETKPVASDGLVKTYFGTVSDETGDPVIGASIYEKGNNTNGAVSDIDGKFKLNVVLPATLVISYLGYKTQEIAVGNNTNLTVRLQESSEALNEFVVIGYGVVKKSDLTGAVASVSTKQFKDQPVKRIEDILQGRTAGVDVTQMSGMPAGDVKVRIRGITSINKSSEPLYVIDGIVASTGLNALNPNDIQSIEVLKDASATAIYGSRGANGVVLVTTKKGVEGKTQIYADIAFGVSNILKKYDLLNAYEYATALNEYKGANTISAADLEAYRTGAKGIDWQNLMLQTGVSQDYKIGFSGGTANNRYHISGNLLDMTAMTITTKFQRGQLRANFDNDLTHWLTVSTKLNAARTMTHNYSIDLMNFLNYSPTMEMRNSTTGVYNTDPFNAVDQNPYGKRVANSEDSYQYHLNGNLNLIFKILKGLTLSVQAGANYAHNPNYTFVSSSSGPGVISSMTNTSGMNIFWQNTNNLTYDTTIGDHHLTLTGVWESSSNEYRSLDISGSGLGNEVVGYWNVKNAETRDAGNSYSADAIVSGLGRLSYIYKGRYMLTGTLRGDASSVFQTTKNKWGFFPSGALAWDIAQEGFMADQRLLQQLKARLSFGVVGNQAINRYSTLGMLTSTTYDGYGNSPSHTGYWANQLATPDVSWESTSQYNAGIDAAIVNSHLNFTFEWFLKDSKNLLFRKQIPLYNGGGTFWVNQGEIKNQGVEISVNATPLTANDPVAWETIFNVSYVKNTIIDLAGDDFVVGENNTGFGGGPMQIQKVGYPLGAFYLYKWKGFNAQGANLYERQSDGSLTTNPTADDLVVMGKSDPSWTFGWNNTLTWKNWTINLFFNAALGYNRLNMSRFALASQIGKYRFISLRESYYQGWDKVTDKANAKYASHSNPDNKTYPDCDFWLEDASFVKLKNVSITYNIPKTKAKIADVQLAISGQNLFTATKYSGMDPEVYSAYDGVDLGAYPIPRTFTFGVKLNF